MRLGFLSSKGAMGGGGEAEEKVAGWGWLAVAAGEEVQLRILQGWLENRKAHL